MAGRTDKVKAVTIEDQMWAIMFEADEARQWLGRLEERAKKNAETAAKNELCTSEHAALMSKVAFKCFEAQDELTDVSAWVAKVSKDD